MTKTKSPSNQTNSGGHSLNPLAILATDFERWQAAYDSQTDQTKQVLDSQAQTLVQFLKSSSRHISFFLPDQVFSKQRDAQLSVPKKSMEQRIGGWLDRLLRRPSILLLRNRLDEMEAGLDEAVSLSAGLIRHATAMQLVYHGLPDGTNVAYRPLAGEEIPTIPEKLPGTKGYAERFFMPDWVALDGEDELLVPTSKDAERMLARMEDYFATLHLAARLAPYMLADKEYQRKRVGILGQFINQGRALAWYQTRAIINLVRKRAELGSLNRGLSISLPYFDDQELELKALEFQIIPPGRIMLILSFVALACRNEQGKVVLDTRLNASTRNHLLGELRLIENAFEQER
jgi:hypothetical protein